MTPDQRQGGIRAKDILSTTSIHNPLRLHMFSLWKMRRWNFGGRWVCAFCHKSRRPWRKPTDGCPVIRMADPTADAPEQVPVRSLGAEKQLAEADEAWRQLQVSSVPREAVQEFVDAARDYIDAIIRGAVSVASRRQRYSEVLAAYKGRG